MMMIHVKRSQRVECPNETNCVRAHGDDCIRCRRNRLHLLDYFDPIPQYPYITYPYWYWSPNDGWYNITTTVGGTYTYANAPITQMLDSAFPDNYSKS
jgi:hypothetical protein